MVAAEAKKPEKAAGDLDPPVDDPDLEDWNQPYETGYHSPQRRASRRSIIESLRHGGFGEEE